MIEVTFVWPGMDGRVKRYVPAVPRLKDCVRLYGGPLGAGPALYWVQDIIWDVPTGAATEEAMIASDMATVEVWLTNSRPKGRK